jgi:hypothetical protein
VLGGPSLSEGGALKLDRVSNMQFALDYAFEYVDEVL